MHCGLELLEAVSYHDLNTIAVVMSEKIQVISSALFSIPTLEGHETS